MIDKFEGQCPTCGQPFCEEVMDAADNYIYAILHEGYSQITRAHMIYLDAKAGLEVD